MDDDKFLELCMKHGWERVEGFKISGEYFSDDFEMMFFPKDAMDEVVNKCFYWSQTTGKYPDERCFEEREDLEEHLEDLEEE